MNVLNAINKALKVSGMNKILRMSLDKTNDGVIFNMEVIMNYGTVLRKCAFEIEEAVKSAMEKYASIYTDAVNITIRNINADL